MAKMKPINGGYFYSEYNRATGCWEMTYRYRDYVQVAIINITRWKDEDAMRRKIIYCKYKMRSKVAAHLGRTQ